MNKNFRIGFLMILMLGFCVPTQAQFFKKLKKAVNTATTVKKVADNRKSSKSSSESDGDTKVQEDNRNEWSKSHEGQVLFYDKYLDPKRAGSDSEVGLVRSAVIAGKKPLYFRAYLNGRAEDLCDGCSNYIVKYTMGGVSITTKDLRDEYPKIWYSHASAKSFMDYNNRAIGLGINAASQRYYIKNKQSIQEDAFRVLLSKIEEKLKKGAKLTLKVEVLAGKALGYVSDKVVASGELPMTVTAESFDENNLNCRMGKKGMNDSAIEKDALEAAKFEFGDTEKVYKVVLNERSFAPQYDNSYPVKNELGKGMYASFIIKMNNGLYAMNKSFIFYDKNGGSYSKNLKIGKQELWLPVSPTCAQ